MNATLDGALADLQQANAELQRQLDECRAELAASNGEYGERIEQQSATIGVQKVMSAPPGDPQPVFDLIRVRDNGIGIAHEITTAFSKPFSPPSRPARAPD